MTFRDIPEAITGGGCAGRARAMARDALVTALDFYVEDGNGIPAPSRRRQGEEYVAMPADVARKVRRFNRRLQAGLATA